MYSKRNSQKKTKNELCAMTTTSTSQEKASSMRMAIILDRSRSGG